MIITCDTTSPSSTICVVGEATNTLPAVEQGFTHGEVIVTFWLSLLTIITIYAFLHFWIRGIRVKP